MGVKVRYEDGTYHDEFRIMNETQQGLQVKSGMRKLLTTKHKYHFMHRVFSFTTFHEPPEVTVISHLGL
jgi:hypothetical protein